jgi:uncharacterized low-complexity protein
MRRVLLLVAVAALMVAMLVASALPALAQDGGFNVSPYQHCGFGVAHAQSPEGSTGLAGCANAPGAPV